MLEKIDPLQALASPRSQAVRAELSKLAINMRFGQKLCFKTADGQAIRIVFDSRYAHGARVVIFAERSVEIATGEA